ncbi:MAG: 30S ribosomal protein S18 [Verrucomicrobia bacterium GWF2_51_19]|nr:MAG: 30S ribosomal protein S18 [Verrucomicrobia bacterium GWF2_51_19]HCJ11652.1 30S ribosomal protein S18 [Opitutae bacterium]
MTEETKRKGILDLRCTDVDFLKRYTTETGKILSQRYTRLSSKQQRHVTNMIKRARNLLLMK